MQCTSLEVAFIQHGYFKKVIAFWNTKCLGFVISVICFSIGFSIFKPGYWPRDKRNVVKTFWEFLLNDFCDFQAL